MKGTDVQAETEDGISSETKLDRRWFINVAYSLCSVSAQRIYWWRS